MEPPSASSCGKRSENATVEPIVGAEKSPSAEEDSINKLPDAVISSIISFLPTHQAARTSVLSRRWESLWKYTSHIFIDQKYLFSSEVQHGVQSAPVLPEDIHARIAALLLMLTEMDTVVGLIQWLLSSHLGSLRSCRILHMIQSCRSDHVGKWVKFLLEEKKEVKELSLECESNPCWCVYKDPIPGRRPPVLELDFEIFSCLECLELRNYIVRTSQSFLGSNSLITLKLQKIWIDAQMLEKVIATCLCLENLSLKGCKKFKKLKVHSPSIRFLELRQMKLHQIDVSCSQLAVLVFETMITRSKGLVIDAPKLCVLCCYCDPLIRGRTRLGFGRLLLTLKQIVTMVRDLLNTVDYHGLNLFESLITLRIDLDLTNMKELTFLPFLLRSCPSLQKLEINNEVTASVQLRNDSLTPHYDFMFWEAREVSFDRWISQGLKTVIIKGFKGEWLEVKFVKYLIAKAARMESIAIWFNDDCSYAAAAAAAAQSLLLEAASTSANLSITLKPGNKYLAEVGGSWEEWISYLKRNCRFEGDQRRHKSYKQGVN